MSDKCYYCKVEQDVNEFIDNYGGVYFICHSCYSVNSDGWKNLKYHFSQSENTEKKKSFLSYFKL